MEDGRPSGTAYGAARLRAAHRLLDDPLVLDDPLALRIIGSEAEAALRADPQRFQTREMRALRASIAVRSRYAEDSLAAAVQRGIRQYVLLGAGLDTFAYRNPLAESDLRVFEVDHPATQEWKRRRLVEAGISIPGALTFVAIDFERETLADALSRAGFATDAPSFFSWLGVTVYLTRDAVMATLGFIASSTPPASEIVFTYGVSPSIFSQRAEAIGEPWRTFFDPPALARDLEQIGFAVIEDLDVEETNRRYFAHRTDGFRVAGSGHLMRARVAGR